MLKEYFAVKLGGSIITPKKSGEMLVNSDILERTLEVIGKYCQDSNVPVLISHGAGSFGHVKARKFLDELDSLSEAEIQERLLEIHLDVKKLNSAVREVVSREIRSDLVFDIIHGDTNFEGPNYIFSTEEQLLKSAKILELQGYSASKIILLTDQDGVLNDDGTVVESVSADMFGLSDTSFEDNKDATGGMQQKVEKALELKAFARQVIILNGLIPERLAQELAGKNPLATRII
jgi:isopentenyl phosphate kinase